MAGFGRVDGPSLAASGFWGYQEDLELHQKSKTGIQKANPLGYSEDNRGGGLGCVLVEGILPRSLAQRYREVIESISYMDLPLVVQRFFDIPDTIDVDNVYLSDSSATESSSSPHLTASDEQFLDLQYWLSDPVQYARLKQKFLPYKLPRTPCNEVDWLDEL